VTARSILAGRRSAAFRRPPIRIPFIGKIEEKAVKTHLLCAIALGLAGTATAASAQDQDSFTVQTTVPKYCASVGADPAPLALGDLSGPTGFVVSSFAGVTSHSIPGYYCNAASTVTLKADPLLEPTPTSLLDTSSFTNRIDYTASLVWDNVTGSDDSVSAAAATIAASEANIGAMTVTVSNPNVRGDTVRPVAGAYDGAVTLSVAFN
jgi:hypothetical protein